VQLPSALVASRRRCSKRTPAPVCVFVACAVLPLNFEIQQGLQPHFQFCFFAHISGYVIFELISISLLFFQFHSKLSHFREFYGGVQLEFRSRIKFNQWMDHAIMDDQQTGPDPACWGRLKDSD